MYKTVKPRIESEMTSAEKKKFIGFEQLPNESAKAYRAFKIYCEFGPSRNQEGVAKKLSVSRQFLARWSAKFKWVERAKSWDGYIAQKDMEAHDKAMAAESKLWADRQRKLRRDDWQLGEELKDAARAILKKQKAKPAGSPADAARISELASKLQRLATGSPTENTRQEISGPEGKPVEVHQTTEIQFDLSKLDKDELAALESIVSKVMPS